MLNTAANRMYWKLDTKNNVVFSKFVASSWSPLGLELGGAMYHDCPRTHRNAQTCTELMMITWPIMLESTFFDIRLAVGRFGYILGYGSVLPTTKMLVNWNDRCFWPY